MKFVKHLCCRLNAAAQQLVSVGVEEKVLRRRRRWEGEKRVEQEEEEVERNRLEVEEQEH